MKPETEAELAEAIRAASELCICGGGTRGGATRGTVLNIGNLRGIELYDPGAMTIVLRAGTPVADVAKTLAGEKQQLAFEPRDLGGLLGRAGVSTIGGVVATNSFGPRRINAGSCADNLLGVRFVDGRGDIIKNGGRVMKNVTGYDLVKLMAGSFGTLGVLSEVSMKVLPLPETEATLRLPGGDPQAAIAIMSRAMRSPYDVSGAAFLPGQGTLIRVEGFAGSVAYRLGQLRALLAAETDDEAVEDPVKSADLWRRVRDLVPFHGKAGDVWRLRLKPSDAPEALRRVAADDLLIDQAGGELWLLTNAGDDLRTRLTGLQCDAVRIRGDTGDVARFAPMSGVLARINTRLRAEFDPRAILNPGLMG